MKTQAEVFREVIKRFIIIADESGVLGHSTGRRLVGMVETMDTSELCALFTLHDHDVAGVHDPLRDAAQYAIDWFTLDMVDFTKKYRDINHLEAWLYPTPPVVARVLREAMMEPVE